MLRIPALSGLDVLKFTKCFSHWCACGLLEKISTQDFIQIISAETAESKFTKLVCLKKKLNSSTIGTEETEISKSADIRRNLSSMRYDTASWPVTPHTSKSFMELVFLSIVSSWWLLTRDSYVKTLRATCCKDHLYLCKIEKIDFLKICQEEGFY